ncbi:hypothetical protein ISCGN_006138, partial [Ixodes scapularis]
LVPEQADDAPGPCLPAGPEHGQQLPGAPQHDGRHPGPGGGHRREQRRRVLGTRLHPEHSVLHYSE